MTSAEHLTAIQGGGESPLRVRAFQAARAGRPYLAEMLLDEAESRPEDLLAAPAGACPKSDAGQVARRSSRRRNPGTGVAGVCSRSRRAGGLERRERRLATNKENKNMNLDIKPLPDFIYRLAAEPVREATDTYAAEFNGSHRRKPTPGQPDAKSPRPKLRTASAPSRPRGRASRRLPRPRSRRPARRPRVPWRRSLRRERSPMNGCGRCWPRSPSTARARRGGGRTVEEIRSRLMPDLGTIESDLLRLEGLRCYAASLRTRAT